MIKLTIKSHDGTVYWIEHFNDQAACDAWLKEEKTRPYWNPAFTVETETHPTPAEAVNQEQARKAAEAELAATNAIKDRLKTIDITAKLQGATTVPQLKQVLLDILSDLLAVVKK